MAQLLLRELTTAVGVHVRPAQASQNASVDGKELMSPFPAEGLLAVDGCWVRKNHFSLGVQPLIGSPHASG